jgi:hypothetical protein
VDTESAVLRINIYAEEPAHRKSANRYAQVRKNAMNKNVMKKKTAIFYLIVLLFQVSLFAQNKDVKNEYINLVKDFVNNNGIKSSFLLSDEPYTIDDECLEKMRKGSFNFSEEEINLISLKTKENKLGKWTSEILPKMTFVEGKKVTEIFEDKSKGWKYFQENVNENFFTFSAPIFFRNNTYCLFYFDERCGEFCGQGILMLFEKKDSKWAAIGSYCEWTTL